MLMLRCVFFSYSSSILRLFLSSSSVYCMSHSSSSCTWVDLIKSFSRWYQSGIEEFFCFVTERVRLQLTNHSISNVYVNKVNKLSLTCILSSISVYHHIVRWSCTTSFTLNNHFSFFILNLLRTKNEIKYLFPSNIHPQPPTVETSWNLNFVGLCLCKRVSRAHPQNYYHDCCIVDSSIWLLSRLHYSHAFV